MSKLWRVAQYEYRQHVLKRSFLVTTLSLPLVVALIVGGSLVARALRHESPAPVGYVDRVGLLADPLALASTDEATVQWIAFPSEETAQAALEAKEVEAAFILPPDYGQTHQVQLIYVGEPGREIYRQFRALLREGLLSGKPTAIVRRAVEGSTLVVRLPDGAAGGAREFSGSPTLGQFLPALAGLALVVLIFFSSATLMGAVTDEKANRTMEILMTSVSPSRLMAGKVFGIIAVTFTQLAAWIVLAGLFVLVGGKMFGLEWLQDIHVDPSTFLITLAVVIPSYVLLAALMTALGAILVDAHAGQQVAMLVVTFYSMSVMLVVPLMRDLNSPLTVGLSLLPLAAPVVLPLRAAFTQVPLWHIAASIAVQIVCALAGLWLAGRALRIGMLRYGRRPRLRELLSRAKAQPLPAAKAPSQRRARREDARDLGATTRGAGRVRTSGKTLLVLRHELVTVVAKPLFLLVCVGVPLLVFFQLAVMTAAFDGTSLADSGPADTSGIASAPAPLASEPEGYVDRSGLIQAVPDEIPTGRLVAYADEAAAGQALTAGDIASFFVIPPGYVETGALISVRPDHSPLSPDRPSSLIDRVLLVNLLGGDGELATQVLNPMELQATAWTPAPEAQSEAKDRSRTGDDDSLTRLLPMLVMLLVYGVIVMASGLLLRSVSEEKKNRVMEVLLLPVSPQQMLTGKIIAMGIAGLLPAAAWAALGYVFFAWGGRRPELPAGIALEPSILVWAAVFFLLGYAVYACLFAAAGALVPNWRQSPQVSILLVLPAFIGFEISLLTTDHPHGALATGASLFPLTASFSMMSRLVRGGVPPWQPLLAAAMLVVTILFIVRAVARMFHAQNLLSGQPFSVRRYLSALMGRA